MEVLSVLNINTFITEEHVKLILSNYMNTDDEIVVAKYSIENASDKMLGFLSDYWKLKVYLAPNNTQLCFFVKAISRSNAAKANMVKTFKSFEKELFFYSVIKKRIEVPGIKPWSARFVTALDDAMVFEDLNALQYKLRHKFDRFDMPHTVQALKALARFHASSFIFEEIRSKELRRPYRLHEDYKAYMDEAGYKVTGPWFLQCMNGALEAVSAYSKYNETNMSFIKARWSGVWLSALRLSDFSSQYRNVICHRDLWNNNVLFHYKNVGNDRAEPDHCVFVDFPVIRYQPPAGDIMVLLCCNLDPKFREENLDTFLNCYLDELQKVLFDYGIALENIINKHDFFASVEEQRLWGLIVCACLLPQFWIDDDLTTEFFCDTKRFDDILRKNKGIFIKKMMQANPCYKEKVMEIFEEIISRYCL